jgi:hypothetical protein
MVTKSKTTQKKGMVEIGKLKINKETVKDLTSRQAKGVRGGKPRESLVVCLSDVCTYTIATAKV